MIQFNEQDKAKVLSSLYNHSKPLGMGYLHFDPKPMTESDAKSILNSVSDHYFDYLKGRVMKIDLNETKINTHLYNRDNGPDAAEEALLSDNIDFDII